ncbi:MAG: glycosyltransferase family 4 protein [Candidatus Pacebacteria bacterium]|nr:glycosyltransferase family 4 protein [Candidatus Paceibacterota bacterium]PIR59543.1 MAG: hypothetical protein COU68_05010 [Candidatus Pacebacteria bacterium CG10_big_fil_rev_8_21_14_0_10_45_6]
MSTATHLPKPKICLVYDRLTTQYGGAEYLLQQLLEVFPDAPLFTALYNQSIIKWVDKKRVHALLTTRSQIANKLYPFFAPLLPLAFESLDLSSYSIVISISSAEAKGVLTNPNQLHINYLFSPPKYLKTKNNAYLRSYGVFKLPGMLALAQLPLRYLRWWDQAAAARPDYIIPISKTMHTQLSGSYAKNSLAPIYPPVAAQTAAHSGKSPTKKPYFLSLSRLVWYKRIDIAIAAAQNTNSLLLIAGEGTMKSELQKQAGQLAANRLVGESITECVKNALANEQIIIFLGPVSPQEKNNLLSNAQATVQMGTEDFGIVAIESLAHGTPAIVFSQSGAAEIIRNERDGLVLANQTEKDLSLAFKRVQMMTFSPNNLREQAKKVSAEKYKKAMKTIVYDVWKTHCNGVKNYAS